MTTTGEYLVSISTLATGPALDHLLNIETGGGGEIITRYIAVDASTIELQDDCELHLEADSDLELFVDDSIEPYEDGTITSVDDDVLEID